MSEQQKPATRAVQLAAWYLELCSFAIDIERKLGGFESWLAELNTSHVSHGGRVEIHYWADELRRVLDQLLKVVDRQLESLDIGQANVALLLVRKAGPPIASTESHMGNMVREIDLRTILAALLESGRVDVSKVTENTELAGRYADQLEERRGASGKGDEAPHPRKR
jgi:hypothetical protein